MLFVCMNMLKRLQGTCINALRINMVLSVGYPHFPLPKVMVMRNELVKSFTDGQVLYPLTSI